MTARRIVRWSGAALTIAATGHALPSVTAIAPLRARITPALAGAARGPHVALSFDDGPDPDSTPRFLGELARLRVHATFFVLGQALAAHPGLGRRIAEEGHEVGVHGWRHRPHLLRSPGAVAADLTRAHACVAEVTGREPRYWRPPHGILTGAALWTGYRLGMRPVLWTADGRDWRADATPATVAGRIRRRLRPGGVILLHDADTMSAPGAWQASLDALPELLRWCECRGWRLGLLGEHAAASA